MKIEVGDIVSVIKNIKNSGIRKGDLYKVVGFCGGGGLICVLNYIPGHHYSDKAIANFKNKTWNNGEYITLTTGCLTILNYKMLIYHNLKRIKQ